jgi:pyruvate dehydrogenase E2 component (dihydrolipoamide acetyltransferase)
MHRQVLMPHLSEEAEEGVVVVWFVEPGAAIKAGDLLAELQVQKASSELHSPYSGLVAELLIQPGGVVAQGAPIAVIDDAEEASTAGAISESRGPSVEEVRLAAAAPAPASPSARRLAKELSVNLSAVTGSGPGGRIVEADVRAAARRAGRNGGLSAERPQVRIEPLTPMRRAIAERLSTWLGSTAQLTLFSEADVTALADALKGQSEDSERGASYIEVVVRALALAIDGHPAVGARWTETGLAYSGRHDIGIAVALPDGLITPVVRDAHRKDIATLSRELAGLAARARAGSLAPADVEGAVLSVTNLGAYRIDGFTPLLNPPQSTILGIGRARWRAAVVDGTVAPRLLMTLSLTFDHRVLDGAPAAAFLSEVVGLLEEPGRLLAGFVEE